MEIDGSNKMTPQVAMITKIPMEYRGDPIMFKFLLIQTANASPNQAIKRLELDIAGGGVQLWCYMTGFIICMETMQIRKSLTDLIF